MYLEKRTNNICIIKLINILYNTTSWCRISSNSPVIHLVTQGEAGKPGEKGLVGRPGLRVSTFSPNTQPFL